MSGRIRAAAGSASVVAFAAAVGYKETVGLVDDGLHVLLKYLG